MKKRRRSFKTLPQLEALSEALGAVVFGMGICALATVKPNEPSDPRYRDGWRTAAANPERTSWVPEEVRGPLKPIWAKPIEPYIQQKVQIIAADGLLYIATAAGLYVLDAETGEEKWVYPTELPVGHSPTVLDGVAYIGCFDRRVHAVDAKSGKRIWATDPAEAGFHCSPLVVALPSAGSTLSGAGQTRVYAGNRDNFLYCFDAKTGGIIWKFESGGMILFSPAYKDGTVYLASNDGHAYAVSAEDGNLLWKSDMLPGGGFHSWWPVVYRDWVIFAGNNNYGHSLFPNSMLNNALDKEGVYSESDMEKAGTPAGAIGKEPGEWAEGTPTLDGSRITEYLEQMPWRRRYFVLDRKTGREYTFDFDADGKPEYAPVLWHGSHSGNRFPPVIGGDGVLYQSNNYRSSKWIPGGGLTGWKFGTPFLSLPFNGWIAVDEPMAYSAGGNCLYWHHWGDRGFGSFDIGIASAKDWPASQPDRQREWVHVCYGLRKQMPGFDRMYSAIRYTAMYGPRLKAVYGLSGDQNAPVPYRGKVYYHACNAVLAFGPNGSDQGQCLPLFKTVPAPASETPALSAEYLRRKLARETEKILAAGHLRPGHMPCGLLDGILRQKAELPDYWHNPADTILVLLRALPHLSADLAEKTKHYHPIE